MKFNTHLLTREFCEKNTLIFYPQAGKTSDNIQRHLFDLGFKWCSSPQQGYRSYQEGGTCRGILLLEGYLYTGPQQKHKQNGLLCSLEDFDEEGVDHTSFRDNKAPITKERCQNERLIFCPETEEEIEFIQQELFKKGCTWPDGEQTVQSVHACLSGISVNNGIISFNPSRGFSREGFLCTSDELSFIPESTLKAIAMATTLQRNLPARPKLKF